VDGVTVCFTCKHLREIVHTDDLERGFCAQCYKPSWDVLFANSFMALTVPFAVGDRVQCRTAGVIYDGIGVVEEVSTELKDGGTWVYPAFRVRFDEKAYPSVPDVQLYTEACLTKVGGDE
jgi:hypothetical protein